MVKKKIREVKLIRRRRLMWQDDPKGLFVCYRILWNQLIDDNYYIPSSAHLKHEVQMREAIQTIQVILPKKPLAPKQNISPLLE